MKVGVSAFRFHTLDITFCVLWLHYSCSSYYLSEASYRSIVIYLSIPQSHFLILLFIPLSHIPSTALQLHIYSAIHQSILARESQKHLHHAFDAHSRHSAARLNGAPCNRASLCNCEYGYAKVFYPAYTSQVVTAIIGYYLYPYSQSKTWPAKRFIFAETWAGLSIILSVLWLVPSMAHKIPWLADFVTSVGWWTSFGLIIQAIGQQLNCGGFFTSNPDDGGLCRNWKTVEAFCFISGIAWIVTGLFGIQFVQARRRGGRGGGRFR